MMPGRGNRVNGFNQADPKIGVDRRSSAAHSSLGNSCRSILQTADSGALFVNLMGRPNCHSGSTLPVKRRSD